MMRACGKLTGTSGKVAAAALCAALVVPHAAWAAEATFALTAQARSVIALHSVGKRLVHACMVNPAVWAAWQEYDAYHLAYRRFADARVVVPALAERAAEQFGPWSARDEFGAATAAADGALTQWDERYYITHDWSGYGQQILQMAPGDVVSLGGQQLEVTRVFDYPKDGRLGEIWELVGESAVVLQTCEPNSDLNRIVRCE